MDKQTCRSRREFCDSSEEFVSFINQTSRERLRDISSKLDRRTSKNLFEIIICAVTFVTFVIHIFLYYIFFIYLYIYLYIYTYLYAKMKIHSYHLKIIEKLSGYYRETVESFYFNDERLSNDEINTC